MRSPSKASFLGTMITILFLLCTGSISSVFARVPLVRRQSNVESQWAQALPGGVVVVDGPEMGNNILNEQVLADTYPVCCTRQESLIEKAITICEKGMSLSFNFTGYYYFFLPLSSQTPSTFYTYLFLPRYVICNGEKVKRKDQLPPLRESKL